MKRCLEIFFVLAFCAITVGTSTANEPATPELLLVYWSSEDCRWCTYWESSLSGMERRLKESEEFKKLKYRVVKNKRLADPYVREDFPSDIAWIFERAEDHEERRPRIRPAWVMYLDRKRIAAFYGTKNWDEKYLPEIKRLVSVYLGQ